MDGDLAASGLAIFMEKSVDIFEKCEISGDKSYREVIEILKSEVSDCRNELGIRCRTKAAVQRMSQTNTNGAANNSAPPLIKTLNNEINDLKYGIDDLEDNILSLQQFENLEAGKTNQTDSNYEKCLRNLQHRLEIEIGVKNGAEKLMDLHKGKAKDETRRLCEKSELKIEFVENRINRLKHPNRDADDFENTSSPYSDKDGMEVAIVSFRNRSMIEGAVMMGFFGAISSTNDRDLERDLLPDYRESYQRVYLYQKAIQSQTSEVNNLNPPRPATHPPSLTRRSHKAALALASPFA